MEEIVVSDGSARSSFITYLYGSLMEGLRGRNGQGDLLFTEDRCVLRLHTAWDTQFERLLYDKVSEILAVGYKYAFFKEKLKVALPAREKRLLIAALIAADLEGDKGYIHSKLNLFPEICIDGVYNFRLNSLREKWQRIIDFVPSAFSVTDLKQFCAFLAGESRHKIYVQGKTVFAENFRPLRLSRLTGEESTEVEIMLSDAGLVYCLGEVPEGVFDFLQKYYAERTVFS